MAKAPDAATSRPSVSHLAFGRFKGYAIMRSTITDDSSRPKLRSGTPSASRRKRLRQRILSMLMVATAMQPLGGCGVFQKIPDGPHDTKLSYHSNHAMQIEYPEVAKCATPVAAAAQSAAEPLVLQDPSELPAIELSLDEAIRRAVSDSPVLRNIGGTIVSAPAGATTVFEPGLAHANPLSGPEAALAFFDAQYTQSLSWTKTDTPNNSDPNDPLILRFTPAALQATGAAFSNQLSKRTAQGGSFALRHVVNYDRNNRPSSFLSSSFAGWVEAEWRQPLMRGAGTQFNRIVGSAQQPGSYNGVLIARLNEDVSLADFENAMVTLVADVEQAYWDLQTAYRLLEANLKGRESALQTLQFQQVRLEVGTGRQDEEAQARSQYYQFQSQVQNALGGETGLYALEQRLRYLIGMAASDGSLIRPTTDPVNTRIRFDWNSALSQALERRVEIRRQRFGVKRRELELYAARLNRRPQLDFLGLYRVRGLGDHLIGSEGGGSLDNLYGEITSGQYEEWQAGMELTLPIGLRAASVAVAHAKLNLQRERAILNETELRISHDLTTAARGLEVTFELVETNYNRYLADLRQVEVLRRRYLDGTDNINFLLQAQRQVVVSEQEFYRSLSNYNLAIRDVHRQKGSLLAYNQIQLGEGPWNAKAQRDAYEVGRFLTPRLNPEDVQIPRPLTSGAFDPAAIQSTGFVSAVDGVADVVVEAQPVEANDTEATEEDSVPEAPGEEPNRAEPAAEGLDVSNPDAGIPDAEVATFNPVWVPKTLNHAR